MNRPTSSVETLGIRISRAREEAGFSIADVASRLRVTARTVERWESDTYTPRLDQLQRLGSLLGTDAAELIRGLGRVPERVAS